KIDLDMVKDKVVGMSVFVYTKGSGDNWWPSQIGYTISGTEKDGGYLEVQSDNTVSARVIGHKLNTPPTCDRAGTINTVPTNFTNSRLIGTGVGTGNSSIVTPGCGSPLLPLTATRLFKFGDKKAAETLPNPMWLAAKYGGFKDLNNNGIPDDGEWNTRDRNNPDNYFYVSNPLFLQQQLHSAFQQMTRDMSTGTATSSSVNSILEGGLAIRTYYYPNYMGEGANETPINWVGNVYGLLVDKWGNLREDTNQNGRLDVVSGEASRGETDGGDWVVNFLSGDSSTLMRLRPDPRGNGQLDESRVLYSSMGDLRPLWDAGRLLNEMTHAQAVQSRPFKE
ncbi:MAG: hypothetical protein ACRCTY_10670, partial [Candidatus Adiutrix sp.]